SFPIQFGTPNVTNVRCFGENTGAIQLRVSGGVPPFQYDWNNGFANTRQLDSIPGGFYQLEITDDNGCVRQSDSILVVQADQAIQLLQEEVNNTRCHDTEDGRIAVEVGGGIAPYQLFWESSDPGNNYVNGDVEMVADLLPGNYVLTVLDSFTCTQQFNFEIIQPEQLEVVKSSTPSERNNNTGTASVLPSGGTLPYSYEWNIENAPDTNFLDQLGAGVYFVTVSDANDCQLTVAIEVKADVMDNTEDLEQLLQFELFPNPMSALLHVKLALEQAERLQIAIYNAQGQLLLQQAPRLIFQEQLSFDLSAFASGAYWLEVRLLDGERVRRRFLKF
ncbi:MAG: T9SS type A sorting domain-containing protein, partial [Bacteroidota bacterium]